MASAKAICKISKSCSLAPRKPGGRKKMMIAVYEVIGNAKPERHSSALGSSFGTPIRVCKGRLTSACNPGVCDCPDEACKVRMKKSKKIWILMKMGIFGYAVAEACRYGIWSDAEKTAQLSERYLAWAETFFSTRNKTARTPEEMYDMFRIKYNLKNVWNNILIGFTSFIGSFPDQVNSLAEYVFKKEQPENPTQ